MKAKFNNANIAGISVCVPKTCIKIDDCLKDVFKNDEKLLKRMKKISGLEQRFIADEKTSVVDLAYEASLNLFKMLKFDKNDLDMIIFITQTPDFFMPSCANYLHKRLNLKPNTIAFDVNQACAGYIYGLFFSFNFLENQLAKNILLICGDTLSKTINPQNPNLAPIFGDGVSATLIKNEKNTSFFELFSDGKGYDRLIIPNKAFAKLDKNKTNNEEIFKIDEYRNLENLYMDGAEIFNQALNLESQSVKNMLEICGKNEDEIDYFLFHQSNKFLVDSIINELNLNTQKTPNFLMSKYANLSACSIPALLCEMNKNDFKAILSAFGAGYAYGSAYINFDKNFKTDTISIYKGEKND
ncbi:beta-ketoacyl-ACP synthase III [Campylobacter lari]|uniref:Beta-ketoacyl-ACP synthase III n=1 Tax=Campylobacter lari TaxID=201 RepID=A0A825SJQ4_CAMLA|nr:beta-ketoacyl-ACP synthase III [Campylobacter lari]EAH5177822.1 beta-ketoacyl-ACP synthase III [Campylobacter lari]EAI1582082.1 beta-ketoacyl-ACP synthase III [Campylobacter lari]EAI4813024.1 beta-ketoacyl-ACP synthase III [Campylobacter lari]EAI4842091.1 beta-ketoacyl-ACP synthase III [Campylobacter lari]EAI9743914.1 beta-ketoacyl-ACP synthase III [Campylobacter lari]